MAEHETTKAAAAARWTKLVKVKQRYIDCLLRRTPITVPFPTLSDKLIDAIHDTPEKRERSRELHARAAEFVKKDRDEVEDILEQYRAYGFAVQEVEVRDGDEDY